MAVDLLESLLAIGMQRAPDVHPVGGSGLAHHVGHGVVRLGEKDQLDLGIGQAGLREDLKAIAVGEIGVAEHHVVAARIEEAQGLGRVAGGLDGKPGTPQDVTEAHPDEPVIVDR